MLFVKWLHIWQSVHVQRKLQAMLLSNVIPLKVSIDIFFLVSFLTVVVVDILSVYDPLHYPPPFVSDRCLLCACKTNGGSNIPNYVNIFMFFFS